MGEVWKEIPGYEGKYAVSDAGNVKSLNYRMTGKEKELKPITSGKGYLMVGLCQNGKMKWAKIHRMVATLFIPNIDDKPAVNHKNGVKTDNRADNLEWVTLGENLQHAYKMGLKKADPEWGRTLGLRHGKEAREAHYQKLRKPVLAINAETGEETAYASVAEVERILGICHSDVSMICRGKKKMARGYSFRYV